MTEEMRGEDEVGQGRTVKDMEGQGRTEQDRSHHHHNKKRNSTQMGFDLIKVRFVGLSVYRFQEYRESTENCGKGK